MAEKQKPTPRVRREFVVSVDMDRLPLPQDASLEDRASQLVSVAKDHILLQSHRRGQICGCGGCKGDAMRDHEAIRGVEQPAPKQEKRREKQKQLPPPSSPLEDEPPGWNEPGV